MGENLSPGQLHASGLLALLGTLYPYLVGEILLLFIRFNGDLTTFDSEVGGGKSLPGAVVR